MASEAVIRALQPGDVPRLLDIAVEAWTPVFAGFREALGDQLFGLAYSDWQERKRADIDGACRGEHGAQVLVAECDGQPVGFVVYHCRTDLSIGEIGNNAVAPAYQGCGIGTSLYEAAAERMREAGMRLVTVVTGADAAHTAARNAYRKAGFVAGLVNVSYFRAL